MSEHRSTELNELFAALSKAQEEIRCAHKDASNPFFKSKYANLQMVIEASRPALCKNNLAVSQQLITENNLTYLYTLLGHSSGQWISSKALLSPVKTDVQSLGSYITYMRRYSYSAIVGVYDGEEDDDGDKAVPEPKKEYTAYKPDKLISSQQLVIIVKLIQSDIAVYNDIITKFKVKELRELKEWQAEEIIGTYNDPKQSKL